MSKINSRDGEGIQKEPSGEKSWHGSSKYQPVELTPAFVFEHASIMTQQEMADMFSITRVTLMERFGQQYHAGKAAKKMKRRKQLEDVIDQLSQTADYNHCHDEAKTNEFLKAMQLWMKRYDDLDKPIIEDNTTIGDAGDAREIRVVRPTKDDM